ncbi:MAG: biopolymer transporter ExbB [Paracoccaceae bacterium]|nr:biopolymer transporter ExbB [Paracoccaceae bacterium]
MTAKDGYKVQFSQPTRQILFMLIVLVLVAIGGSVLGGQIRSVFYANVYLNGVIAAVFLFGVFATFWQVAQIIIATRWLKNLEAGRKGHEFTKPPRILAAMAPMMREGRMQQRMATSSTRSILDSIATRLDEMRDITRYITSLLIFLGLLGTFWGLSITVPAVVDTIRSLAPQEGQESTDVFERLMSGLEDQLGGMGTAFASSLLGLAGSLVVGLLELFAGHGQNRFYRELEEWLSSFTRLGLISEGEGPEGGLIALLERIDEGLEMTTGFAKKAEEARIDSERRLGRAADVVGEMANQMEKERALMGELLNEMREARELQAGRDHATLTVLKRIEGANELIANAQTGMIHALERSGFASKGAGDGNGSAELQALGGQLREIAHDVATGRRESTAALRAEIRALINLIDTRTKPPGAR